MRWIEIFRMYNCKMLKKDRAVIIFTMISLLVTISVSIIIPQISLEHSKYLNSNIKDLNGGDLKVVAKYPSEKFDRKLEGYKKNGLKVKKFNVTTAFFKLGNNKVIGKLIVGDSALSKNEMILDENLAKSLKISVGDKIKIDGNGNKQYNVKLIEPMAKGVDDESGTIGYAKINKLDSLSNINASNENIILISGENGEKLKKELKHIESGYEYTSIADKEKSINESLDVEMITLNILNTMGYILSILAVLSSTIMIILKRKKDFAILRMLAIDIKAIKRAMKFELSLIIIIPLIVACITNLAVTKFLLKVTGFTMSNINADNILIIIKGLIFNGVLFLIFLSIAMLILSIIKPLSIIREDDKEIKRVKKKIGIVTAILMPIVFFAYAVFMGRTAALTSSIAILVFIIIFLCITSLIIKTLSLLPFRNVTLMYSFNGIKKNFGSFVLILINITLTLWFVLIGYNLQHVLKSSINNSMQDKLPYNYMVKADKSSDAEKTLKNNKFKIDGYDKIGYVDAKVINKGIKLKDIRINEINKNSYEVKFKVLEGKGLFNGDSDGILISNEYKNENHLKLGDIVKVETTNGEFDFNIKGIYECGGVNKNWVLKQSNGLFKENLFLVKTNNNSILKNLKNSYIANMNIVGDALVARLNQFLNVFKWLCFLCIFSSLLFNINIVYINHQTEEKDGTIVRAIGIGKGFLLKYQYVKGAIVIIISTIMAYGIYYLMLKLALVAMYKVKVQLSIATFSLTLVFSIIAICIVFSFPIRKIKKMEGFELLREQI